MISDHNHEKDTGYQEQADKDQTVQCDDGHLYRAAFDRCLEAMIILDDDGRFVHANPVAHTLFGVCQGRLSGRKIVDFLEPSCDFRQAWEAFRRVGQQTGELPIIRHDGSVRYAEFSATSNLLPNRHLLVLADITERKRIETALREAEAKYRSLVENSLVGIYMIQGNRFTYVNPCLAEIFGYTQEEIVTEKTVMDLVAPQSRRLVAMNIRKRLEGKIEHIHYSFRGLRKDDRVIDVEVLGTRITCEGSPAIIGSLLDITERRRAEEEHRALEMHKREFYRLTILAATDGKLVITEPDEIRRIAGTPIAHWNIKHADDLSSIRHSVAEMARSVGMEEPRISDFLLAVGEAATNAFKHAGGGTATLHRVDFGLLFKVSDRGSGIEALALPEVALKKGYSTAISLGMGYKMMISVADKVYLATGPSGTTVAIEMGLHPPQRPTGSISVLDTWARL